MLLEQLAQHFAIVRIDQVLTGGPPITVALVVQPQSLGKFKQAQEDDLELQDLLDRTRRGEASLFYLPEGGVLTTSSGRTVFPNDAELRRDILVKAHQTRYIVHLGNNRCV